MKRILIVPIVLMIMVASCSKRVVPMIEERIIERTDTIIERVETIVTDTVRETVKETVIRYDSVAPILDSLNRVIGYDRWHFRERESVSDRERARLLALVDSLQSKSVEQETKMIPYPVEVVKEVEKPLAWWQATLIWIGAAALCLLLAVLYAKIRSAIRNRT